MCIVCLVRELEEGYGICLDSRDLESIIAAREKLQELNTELERTCQVLLHNKFVETDLDLLKTKVRMFGQIRAELDRLAHTFMAYMVLLESPLTEAMEESSSESRIIQVLDRLMSVMTGSPVATRVLEPRVVSLSYVRKFVERYTALHVVYLVACVAAEMHRRKMV